MSTAVGQDGAPGHAEYASVMRWRVEHERVMRSSPDYCAECGTTAITGHSPRCRTQLRG
jgi:hypothetical protein